MARMMFWTDRDGRKHAIARIWKWRRVTNWALCRTESGYWLICRFTGRHDLTLTTKRGGYQYLWQMGINA